jgi:hypothetical protein
MRPPQPVQEIFPNPSREVAVGELHRCGQHGDRHIGKSYRPERREVAVNIQFCC